MCRLWKAASAGPACVSSPDVTQPALAQYASTISPDSGPLCHTCSHSETPWRQQSRAAGQVGRACSSPGVRGCRWRPQSQTAGAHGSACTGSSRACLFCTSSECKEVYAAALDSSNTLHDVFMMPILLSQTGQCGALHCPPCVHKCCLHHLAASSSCNGTAELARTCFQSGSMHTCAEKS